MKRKTKFPRQGQSRFRCLIEVVRYFGLFRPLRPDDARNIFQMASEPHMHFSSKPLTTKEEVDEWIASL